MDKCECSSGRALNHYFPRHEIYSHQLLESSLEFKLKQAWFIMKISLIELKLFDRKMKEFCLTKINSSTDKTKAENIKQC